MSTTYYIKNKKMTKEFSFIYRIHNKSLKFRVSLINFNNQMSANDYQSYFKNQALIEPHPQERFYTF